MFHVNQTVISWQTASLFVITLSKLDYLCSNYSAREQTVYSNQASKTLHLACTSRQCSQIRTKAILSFKTLFSKFYWSQYGSVQPHFSSSCSIRRLLVRAFWMQRHMRTPVTWWWRHGQRQRAGGEVQQTGLLLAKSIEYGLWHR